MQQAVVQRVDRGEAVDLILLQLLDEALHVARIGDQQVDAAGAHRQQEAHRQREDVIERQRAHDEDLIDIRQQLQRRLQPGIVLQHVGDDVAVQQSGALRHAGRAAGVLQERDVVRTDDRLDQLHLATSGDHVVERHRLRQIESRHHLLDAANHEIDDQALEAEHVAHGGDDHVLDRRLGDHLLNGAGKVFQHHDRFGAGILELMLEFARGVERIDVHHRKAGAQHRGGRHRILQHVGHHHGDARALLQALVLQIGAESRRHLVEFAIGDRLVHADERFAIGEFSEAFFEQIDQRRILRGINVRWYARWIVLKPDALHDVSPQSFLEPPLRCPGGITLGRKNRVKRAAATNHIASSIVPALCRHFVAAEYWSKLTRNASGGKSAFLLPRCGKWR